MLVLDADEIEEYNNNSSFNERKVGRIERTSIIEDTLG